MIIYTHRIYIYIYIHADLKSWPTMVFDQACAQHDTAGWISWTPSHPTSSPIRTPCRWRSLDSRLVLPVWPGSIHLSYWNLLRWSKELWNGQYGKDCDTQKKVKCCYWTLIYSTTINGSTGARSCWPLTIPLNQSFDHSVNQQDCSISQPTARWLTHFLTHSITQSTTQWIN